MDRAVRKAEGLLRKAIGAYRGGKLAKAEAICPQIMEALNASVDLIAAAPLLARAHELRYAIFADRGQLEAALHALLAAAKAVEPHQPTHRAVLGRVQLSLIQLCWKLELKDEAEHYLLAAEPNVKGTDHEIYYHNIRDSLFGYDELDNWRDELQRINGELVRVKEALERTRGSSDDHYDAHSRRRDSLEWRAAMLQVQNGTDEEALEGFHEIADTGIGRLKLFHDLDVFSEACEVLGYLLERPTVYFDGPLAEVVRVAFEEGHNARSPVLVGEGHHLEALRLFRRKHSTKVAKEQALVQAMEHASTSVALGTECLVRTTSHVLRGQLRERLDYRRDLALMIAVALDDGAAAAELIECQRLQSLPVSATQLGTDTADARLPTAEFLKATDAALGMLSYVSVGGDSRLAGKAARFFPGELNVSSLERVVKDVGGQDAYWWGTFVTFGRIHWAVLEPSGTITCGTIYPSKDEREAIVSLEKDISSISDRSPLPVWGNHKRERDRLAHASKALMPPLLRRQLQTTSNAISLVVCGNIQAALPLATLVLDEASDLRLIERTVIRVQPPAFLVNQRPETDQVAKNYRLELACVDPHGDLRNARPATPLPATVTLTNVAWEPRSRAQATRANMIGNLTRIGRGTPGIFFYSGHVGSIDGGLNTVLQLQEDDLLAAGDWMGAFGEPGLPCPTRAVISGCGSSDASGAGGGEWLGLSAALIGAGARQVIATAWPIYDTKFTAQFDFELVLKLETADDPAELLATLQRRALADWRESAGSRRDPQELALPVIWGAFQCIGVMDLA